MTTPVNANPLFVRLSIADQVASALRDKILNGYLRPGTPIKEALLASSLGVSRNTMREAMRILCIEGLLTRHLNRKLAITQLSLEDIKEIYYIRHMLEISAVLAARKRSKKLLSEIEQVVQAYETAITAGDRVQATHYDLQFHSLLIRFHRNQRLDSFYQVVVRGLRPGLILLDHEDRNPRRLIAVHRKIFDLIVSGRLKECTRVLSDHLNESECRVAQLFSAHTQTRGDNQSSAVVSQGRPRGNSDFAFKD